MHFVFHILFVAAKAVFFALPGVVAFLIAAASLAVFYMEELQSKLKDQRVIRWIAAIALLLVGIGAFAADKIQKNQERGEREQAIKDTAKEVAAETSKQVTEAVTDQYSQMVADQKKQISDLQAQLAAQSKDVNLIKDSNIVTGKKPVKVEVINPTSGSNAPAESLPNLSWTQEQTEKLNGKAALMIDFRVDDFLKLPAFIAVCDKPCTTYSAGALIGMTQATYLSAPPNAAGAIINLPRPLPPATPCRIRLVSADTTPIKVLSFRILKESEIPMNLR
jgi:hypothetical protein